MMVATFSPETHYLGKLCPRGHDYNGTGMTLRYLKWQSCCVCEVERNRKRIRENPEWRERLNQLQKNRKPLTPEQKARKLELQRIRNAKKSLDPEWRKKRGKVQYEFKKRKKLRDPYFALTERIRDRFKKAMDHGYKKSKCGRIDYDAIARHVGLPPSKDHELDHIMPLNVFDLTDWDQVLQAFAPENHRWIPKSVNRGRPVDGSDLDGWQSPLPLSM